MEKQKIRGHFRDITISDNLEEISATRSHSEYSNDPSGYFLIKLDRENKNLEVGYCTPENKLIKKIIGKTPVEIFYTISRMNLISKEEHAAYMGSELEKAYIALHNDLEYTQDQDLDLKRLYKPND